VDRIERYPERVRQGRQRRDWFVQLAVESKTNPAAPLALRSYGIKVNPIASIGVLSQLNKARDRVLSTPELGAFSLSRRCAGRWRQA
jgi:hypothetical protein